MEFISFGHVMPILKTKDGYIKGSYDILKALDTKMDGVEEDWEGELRKLETLFLEYALTRPVPVWKFFHHWASIMDEPADSFITLYLKPFHRPLIAIYFFVLINIGKVINFFEKGYVFNEVAFFSSVNELESGLPKEEKGKFFGGTTNPNQLDYALFGHMQCMACGVSDETLVLVRTRPRLMKWMEDMEKYDLHKGYGRMYSKRFAFEPGSTPSPCEIRPDPPMGSQLSFWLGFILWICLFPNYLLCFVFLSLLLRYRNTERSGRRVSRTGL